MAAVLPTSPDRFPEPSVTEFSISVLIHRISTLPKEDADDLFDLVRELGNTRCDDEIESIRLAMLEILDQRKEKAVKLDLAPKSDGLNLKWKHFVSERLKAIRKEKNLTQEELADRSGIPQSHVSRIENALHSPSRKTLERLADALEVPVSTFDPSCE